MFQPSQNTEHPGPQGPAPPGEKLSPYEVMLQSAPPDYLTNPEGAIHDLPPEYPVYYFFYETLTAPQALQRIIDLPDEPKLRKARLIGYALARWGNYPALIDGEQGQEIAGHAYLVQCEEEARKLAY